MANKFALGIQERLEQEARQQKKKAETPNQTVESEMPEASAPPGAIQEDAEPGWSRFIRRDNERIAKNKTFYLDMAVIDAIRNAARNQRVAESKLVNDILLHVLVGE